MMEATRVTIAPKTLAEYGRPLKHGEKSKIRRQLVLDYLRDRPYMEKTDLKEVARLTQMSSGNVSSLLNQMVKRGQLYKTELSLKRYNFSVQPPVKTNKLKLLELPSAAPLQPSHVPARPIADLAKQFFWETGSLDLKEFIKWYDQNESH